MGMAPAMNGGSRRVDAEGECGGKSRFQTCWTDATGGSRGLRRLHAGFLALLLPMLLLLGYAPACAANAGVGGNGEVAGGGGGIRGGGMVRRSLGRQQLFITPNMPVGAPWRREDVHISRRVIPPAAAALAMAISKSGGANDGPKRKSTMPKAVTPVSSRVGRKKKKEEEEEEEDGEEEEEAAAAQGRGKGAAGKRVATKAGAGKGKAGLPLRLKGGEKADATPSKKKVLPEGSTVSPRKRVATPKKAAAAASAASDDDDKMGDSGAGGAGASDSGQEGSTGGERSWKVEKAGDLEVLSTRESVLKRPDMWIGDVSTVVKPAFEVRIEEVGKRDVTPGPEDGGGQGMVEDDASPGGGKGGGTTPIKTPLKSSQTPVKAHPGTPAKDDGGIAGGGAGGGGMSDDNSGDLRPQLQTPTKLAAAGMGGNADGTQLVARQREMKVNAGVLKTFDEIIVNAVDRQVEVEDMREIRVTIVRETGELGVWNDGPGIEPSKHKSGKGLVPEVAFGEFMASTNFDDDTRKRFTGGRFGVGAKATNAWSKWFEVTTRHEESGKAYNQTWYDNMERKSEAVVTKSKGRGYTEIRWLPDYARFGMMDGLDEDTYACMVMRVYDLCACTRESIKIKLNGVPLPFQSLAQYADLFWGKRGQGYGRERIHFTLGDAGTQARLEVVLAVSASAHLEARGMVNGVLCSQGTHVEFVVNKVSDGLVEKAVKQLKKDKMKYDDSKTGLSKMKTYFRQHMALLVVALLPNPRFDGQTKERLTLHPKEWGFAAAIDDKLVDRIDKKLGLVDKVLMESEARNLALLQRKSAVPTGTSARVSIAKYQGANMAGKAGRPPCYLLATEGDSAKDLAVCGMEIVGRDCYGVIPLRGVIRNVRPAKVNAKVLKDFLKNVELAAINKVLGLQFGTEYTPENVGKLLRYDHFVIFCDQDPDGAHIAGELINYFTIMFPSLLRAKPDFLMRLGTPIIRLKPKHKGDKAISFFTSAAFRTWFTASGLTDAQLHRKYSSKYLKGLASSNEDDAHFYFSNLDKHLVRIVFKDDTDDEVVDKWFRKNRADDRKVLLSRTYDPDVCVDYSAKKISFPTYFDREYIHYPHYAIYRTIPNVMDGLKPSQRKVLYTAFKRRYKEPVKVVQFAGAILETAAYHHGDAALQGAIIAMARRYCGSNNINLLHPDGQFGSRHSNHAGAARYISAGLEKLTRLIFREEDDAILKHLRDDGQTIEPEYFLPVLPMALINGCEAGIAVGWSSFVPMYNPKECMERLRERMDKYEADGHTVLTDDIPGVIDAALSKGSSGSSKVAEEEEDDASLIPAPAAATTTAEEVSKDEDENKESVADSIAEDESMASTSSITTKVHARDDGFIDQMVPWYDGFEGDADRVGPHSFRLRGKAEFFEPDKKGKPGIISITEVGPTLRSDALREAWKERFGPVEVKDAKRSKAPEAHQFLRDEQVFSTATKIHIDLTVDADKLRAAAGVTNPKKKISSEKLERLLGISETVSTTNVHLFDATMTMRRFATPEAVMEHFFRHRIAAYDRRKQHQIEEMKERVKELSNKARYCTMVHDGDLSIVKKKVADRISDLEKNGFDRMLPKGAKSVTAEAAIDPNAEPEVPTDLNEGPAASNSTVVATPSFDYLLRVSTLMCTTEHAAKLRKDAETVKGHMQKLIDTKPVDMWRSDLNDLEDGLKDFDRRKADALNKGKAPRHKPPQHKHKGVVISERRSKLKQERNEEEKAEKASRESKLKKQVESREVRELARRAKVFKSPSAAKTLASRPLHKPKTPGSKTPKPAGAASASSSASATMAADGDGADTDVASAAKKIFSTPVKGKGSEKGEGEDDDDSELGSLGTTPIKSQLGANIRNDLV